jgi:hypothetical protein
MQEPSLDVLAASLWGVFFSSAGADSARIRSNFLENGFSSLGPAIRPRSCGEAAERREAEVHRPASFTGSSRKPEGPATYEPGTNALHRADLAIYPKVYEKMMNRARIFLLKIHKD